MAFQLQYLAQATLTREYGDSHISPAGPADVALCDLFTYNGSATGANDTNAAIQTANYFDGAAGYLAIGDTIVIQSNDPAKHILNVTAINPHVTTAQVV